MTLSGKGARISPMLNNDVEALYERLLEAWYDAERGLIGEFSIDLEVEEAELEKSKQDWREAFYAARRREGQIYEGDDD